MVSVYAQIRQPRIQSDDDELRLNSNFEFANLDLLENEIR